MRIWRVKINARSTRFDERSEHLVRATRAEEAIRKACAEAKKHGTYKRYEAEEVSLVGDAL